MKLTTAFLLSSALLVKRTHAHGVEVRQCVSADGASINFYVQHWHGSLSNASQAGTMTIQEQVGNNPSTQVTKIPDGVLNNYDVTRTDQDWDCLGGTGTIPQVESSCNWTPTNSNPGQFNSDNQWVYYSYDLECNVPVTYTLLSGNTAVLFDSCGTLYPASISSTFSCTKSPSGSPSSSPTKEPTKAPSLSPSKSPSKAPSLSPSSSPTMEPTKAPSLSPSKAPSKSPSLSPTQAPSGSPTKSPSTSPSASPTKADLDGDGVFDDEDECLGTTEENVPEIELKPNHFVLSSDGINFDKGETNGKGEGTDKSFTIQDTRGCSCEQIIEKLGLGNGHRKFGCSPGVMDCWVNDNCDDEDLFDRNLRG